LSVVAEEDFLGLRVVQFKVIFRRPCCNVIDLCGLCTDVKIASARDDKVSVISELHEYVVVVEWSEISCCDSVGGWSNARALYDAGSDAVRDVSIEHGMVRVTAEKIYQLVVDRRRQVEFSQLGQQRGVSDGAKRLGKVQ